MDDLVTLCLLGVFVIVGLMLLMRMFGGAGRGPNMGGQGPDGGESPQYDDPNIRSRGFFGRSGGSSGGSTSRRFDAPNVRSRGFFGRSGGSSSSGSSGSQGSGRVDNPNVRSRGGFGRSKK